MYNRQVTGEERRLSVLLVYAFENLIIIAGTDKKPVRVRMQKNGKFHAYSKQNPDQDIFRYNMVFQ